MIIKSARLFSNLYESKSDTFLWILQHTRCIYNVKHWSCSLVQQKIKNNNSNNISFLEFCCVRFCRAVCCLYIFLFLYAHLLCIDDTFLLFILFSVSVSFDRRHSIVFSSFCLLSVRILILFSLLIHLMLPFAFVVFNFGSFLLFLFHLSLSFIKINT